MQRFFDFLRMALVAAIIVPMGTGCAAMIRNAAQPTMDGFVLSIMKQKDIDLVRDGAPSYLLLIDGLLETNPDSENLLMAAAQLYSAYCSAFVVGEDPERAKLMSKKARTYAITAMSLHNEAFGDLYDRPYNEFEPVLDTFSEGDEKWLFLVISTWASYIQTHSSDWDNIADIAKIRALTEKLLELDETYYYGSPHLMMGILESLLPPAYGGKPEEAKKHFEQAIALSEGKFLQTHVIYAQNYARLVFDRETHDRLLHYVMDTPADIVPELTLINTLAKKQAEKLLASADEYF